MLASSVEKECTTSQVQSITNTCVINETTQTNSPDLSSVPVVAEGECKTAPIINEKSIESKTDSNSRSESIRSRHNDALSIPLEISIKKKDKISVKLPKSIFPVNENLEQDYALTPVDLSAGRPHVLLVSTLNESEALEKMKDDSVSSLLKKIGIPTSDETMTRMIDLLDEELSEDDGESLSLILALTRSETDTSSINGSVSPQSSSFDRDILRKDINSILTSSKTSGSSIIQTSTFKHRIDRARAMAMKAKRALDKEKGQVMTPQSSNFSSIGNKSTFPRSPLLTALLQRLNKGDEEKGKEIEVFSKGNLVSVEIPNVREEAEHSLNIGKEKSERALFSFDQLVTDDISVNKESVPGQSLLCAQSCDSLSASPKISSKAEANSPRQLSNVLDRLSKNAEKSESFSVTSADVVPLDVDDLFKRYDKIVKHMVVLDEDRLARAQARSTPSAAPINHQNVISDSIVETSRHIVPTEMSPKLQRIRSHSVGSIGLHQTRSDLSTPSQKARDLREQLEKALQSSAAIRNTQAKLGKELSTLQWKVQERRVQGQSRFSTKSAPSSPQVTESSARDRNFYHRNCCTPSTGKDSKSTTKGHFNKSPIARLRERSVRKNLREFGSLRSKRSLSVDATKRVPGSSYLVVDTLPHDVSIVDLVSRSSEFDGKQPTQFPSIGDLESMSQEDEDNKLDKSSDIVMNYSDDNDDDPIQQQQIQSILSGLYQVESTVSQQQSSSFGGTPTSSSIRRTTSTKNSKK